MLSAMDDLGAPTSYLALNEGVPVYSSDGKMLGKVEHVLAEPEEDIFDGFVIDTSVLPGGHRFVDAPEVASIAERAVTLTLDAAQAARLPKPGASPAELSAAKTVGREVREGETEIARARRGRSDWCHDPTPRRSCRSGLEQRWLVGYANS